MSLPSDTNMYEHGIAVEDDQKVTSLRILATGRLPIYSGFTLTIVDGNGRSLNDRAAHLANVSGPHASADYFEESDLRYCVLATLYHLNRLIDLYVENTRLFERTYPPGTAAKGNVWNASVFYEIDSFLGAARRVYESIRKVLWKHYQGRGTTGRWSSIRKVLNATSNVPASFLISLTESWQSVGDKLTAYRDCVAHYEPLTDGGTTCWLEQYEGKWGVTVKLPANPEAQSRASFDFESGPEALEYCHSVACHLVELCELLEAEPEIRSYLDNPPT
jgi:hypothetical protein